MTDGERGPLRDEKRGEERNDEEGEIRRGRISEGGGEEEERER